jgi:hypothetical protein
MTSLPPVIRKAGFELTLIQRVGRVALYRQHLPGGNPSHDAYTNHEGEPVEPYESYPAAESWGKRAGPLQSWPRLLKSLSGLKRPRAGEPQAVRIVLKSKYGSGGGS